MGVSDLAAEAIVIVRITWRGACPLRFTRGWTLAYAVAFLPLPALCHAGALPGVLGFALVLLAFEVAIVGLLACTVSAAGGGRTLLVSCFGAASAVGKVTGDLVALRLFELGGGEGSVGAPAALGCLLMLLSAAVAHKYLRPAAELGVKRGGSAPDY
jgi:hypothetical protein